MLDFLHGVWYTATMVWFSYLNKRDARSLASWWNTHHSGRFFVEKMQHTVGLSKRRARYQVVREVA